MHDVLDLYIEHREEIDDDGGRRWKKDAAALGVETARRRAVKTTNVAALETKKMNCSRSKAPITYIEVDPLALVHGWNRC